MSKYNVKQLTVSEIIDSGFKFRIPEYQRGYRWGETEVKDLLSDISEIKDVDIQKVLEGKEKVEYYCLQPVVFDTKNESENLMFVVDGQQRLTTLFLITLFINNKISSSKEILENIYGKGNFDNFEKHYSLEYVNKERQEIFSNLQSNISCINKSNIDAYYMTKAYETITEWAKSLNGILDIVKFAIKLYKGTTVIWYELDPETDGDAGDYFAKINSGKIALTNSELIKANLMLDEYCLNNVEITFTEEELKDEVVKAQKVKNYKELKNTQLSAERIKISRQWDEIEENLRNNEFWHFITDLTEKYNDTRIDFLFDILAKQKYSEIAEEGVSFEQFIQLNEERATFIILARYLKKQQLENHENPVSIQLWKEIWNYYMTFKEWFNNRELYHYIGYIIAVDPKYKAEKLLSIVTNSKFKNKNDIKTALIEIIKYEIGLTFYKNNKDKEQDELKNTFNNVITRTKKEYFNLIDDLDYETGSEKPLITKTLILFNVLSILNDKTETIQAARDTFFPYGRYKAENWNLEHVHSRADGESFTKESAKLYIEYIEKMLKMLTDKNSEDYKALKLGYDEFQKQNANLKPEKGDAAYAIATHECAVIIEKQFGAELKNDFVNGIGNLALLDEKTNKSYHNVPFFMKRMIISNIVNGEDEDVSRFIPLCTRNVFDKSYSEIPGNTLHWTDKDCIDYSNIIKDTIWNFFEENK